MDSKEELGTIVDEILLQANDALQGKRPLFLIVHYEHEASKIEFLAKLRQALLSEGITPQTFDPCQRPEHGTGKLYTLLTSASEAKSLALIAGLPHILGGGLDTSFLEYLNLHRDLISKKQLRFVIFLHAADAADFISGAGDLWDFRHHTYWLEKRVESENSALWELPERAERMVRLTEEEREKIENHLDKVHSLINRTTDPEEKASLFLDLSHWLRIRNLSSLAVSAALEGLRLLPNILSPLRGDLEFALGYALKLDHHFSDSLAHYCNALTVRREIGDRAGEGVVLNNMSLIYKIWGRYEEALKMLEESFAIRREIGDQVGEVATLNNIAQIYRAWGRTEEAIRSLEESLAICRAIGNRAGEGTTLNSISLIYKTWGRNEDSLKALEESLAIRREIGDRAGEGAVLNNISQIYDSWGRYEEALKMLEQSLVICREIGNRAGEGTVLNNISQIYKTWGRDEDSLKALEESLAIRREIGDRAGEGTVLNNISQIYEAWGRNDEALRALEESLVIRREIGDRAGEGVTCWNMAVALKRRGDLKKAVEYARCTVEIDEETNNPDIEKDRAYLADLEQSLTKQQEQ